MRQAKMEWLIKANIINSKKKTWTERDYPVQEDSDVVHKNVNMFLNTN